ncbi:YaiI/YqxD family protein [Alicyclobacillus sp. ALC3]|uniref:YaiI/YqxD family protein n=1 Tax=Alicyclobacillus sp. ALC3 TaxID=2796143 RepID=UPI0023798DF9|nr:DUF188 domain-containing protein [Alicyclobacillus sp. ALC3]WDL95554.1 DUF188 domain-containing protein [Alicyclobacillus sp. ALC3]
MSHGEEQSGALGQGPQPNRTVTVYVDADATPRDALQTVDREARAFGASVITISSVNHQFDRPNHITVDPHPQAVDMEIVRRVRSGLPQIVVTQDYGLAALVLGKGARALSPTGLVYDEGNIDRLLWERDLHARERRATGRSKGPKKRSEEDKERFARAFTVLLQELTRT